MSHQKVIRRCVTTGYPETWTEMLLPSRSAPQPGLHRVCLGPGRGAQSLRKLCSNTGCQTQASFHAVTRREAGRMFLLMLH